MQMLTDRLELLQERSSTRPLRHQILCSAIDWSYNLLDEHEKQLFTNFSVFSGGCSFQAVEQVCGTPDINAESSLLDTLASLIDKSLIRQEIVDGDSRFSMLETIGECARTRLGESVEAGEVRDRHANYSRPGGDRTFGPGRGRTVVGRPSRRRPLLRAGGGDRPGSRGSAVDLTCSYLGLCYHRRSIWRFLANSGTRRGGGDFPEAGEFVGCISWTERAGGFPSRNEEIQRSPAAI